MSNISLQGTLRDNAPRSAPELERWGFHTTTMANLGFVEAFAKCKAKLDNPMWAVSAIAEDRAFVMSGWAQYFKSGGRGVLLYQDSLSRWVGNNLGNKLLESHLSRAFAEALPVRMVVATAENPDAVEREPDASKIKKTFHVLENMVGRVTKFDGDNYVIELRRP